MTYKESEDDPAGQHEVRLRLHGSKATVEVGGRDLTNLIRSVSLHQSAGQPSQVVLEVSKRATTDIHLDGLARVVVGVPPHPGDAAAAFLSAIDPGQLEQTALKRHDLMGGGSHEMTRIMLTQLIEWAKGTADVHVEGAGE